jgi:D-aspartate ligase
VSSSGGVLLLGADSYGTLAAARCYAQHGFRVSVAGESRVERTTVSRAVAERLRHPPLVELDAVVQWLVAWGKRHPGTLLYPSTDDVAWLLAVERERLAPVFHLLSPSEETILELLDKTRLAGRAAEVGLSAPRSVEGEASIEGSALRYPLLVKPRSRVFLQGGIKGFIVRDQAQLGPQLARFRRLVTFHKTFSSRHPELTQPVVQEYLGAAETSIISVAGFVANGDHCALASTKVLQRPRKLGIGLCFEERELDDELLQRLVVLCRNVGYEGIFEAELVATDEGLRLIDFNPRFYSQLGFEVARGLLLPLLVWDAATGDRESAQGRRGAPMPSPDRQGRRVYCHKTLLDLMLVLQRLCGRMSPSEVRHWRRWYADARRGAVVTDAVRDRSDVRPAVVDAVKWILAFLRHPRSFLNDFVLNR